MSAIPLYQDFEPASHAWQLARSLELAERDRFGSFVSLASSLPQDAMPGPLSGLPYGAKDNIDTVAFPTTANTPALVGSFRNVDNPVIRRLSHAGAQLLGKTNMHELALGIVTNAAAFPATVNPRDPSLAAGGSSGGSAAAVASGIVPFALATDTGGSISIPSAWCGVFGFRPTPGRWPLGGVVPLSPTRDTLGVIAANLELISVVDTVATDGTATRVEMVPTPLPIRLGIPKPESEFLAFLTPGVRRMWGETLQRLSDSEDIELTPIETDTLHSQERSCGTMIELYEIPHALTAYLADAVSAVTLDQLIEEVARDDVRTLLMESLAYRYKHKEYEVALSARRQLQRQYADVFKGAAIDAIIYPTTPICAPKLEGDSSGEPEEARESVFEIGTRNLNPGSVAGQPVVTIPTRLPGGNLGAGVSVEGWRFGDRELLNIAAHISPLLT